MEEFRCMHGVRSTDCRKGILLVVCRIGLNLFLSSSGEQLFLVKFHLGNALKNIVAGQMHFTLGWNLSQEFLTAPTPGGLFNGAHIKDAIVQVLHDLRIWLSDEEGLVSVDTVASEQCGTGSGDMTLNVGQQRVGGGAGAGR